MNRCTPDLPGWLVPAAESSSLLNGALILAEQGLPVFPCDPRQKRPWTTTGFKAATTDRNQISGWWASFPEAAIGMPTGATSGFVVIDLDKRPDKDGIAAFKALEEQYGRCPSVPVVRTPSGGQHLYFRHPGGTRRISSTANKLAVGVDVRADGGYVLVPPSVGYLVEKGAINDAPDPPSWLLDKILQKNEPAAGGDEVACSRDDVLPVHAIEDALSHISPDCSRDIWIKVGMAVHFAGTVAGQLDYAFAIWNEWSSKATAPGKYPGERALRQQWRSFKADKANPITLDTLFKIARDHGYLGNVDAEKLFENVQTQVTPIQQPNSSPSTHKSWGELAGRIFDPIDWVIQDLLPPGVSLLVGRPKQGKSWLVHTIALHVAAGLPVFGLKTTRSPVLYLALEDSERRMQLRTRKLMTTHGISDELLHHSFNYQIDAPRLGEGLEDTLREKMQDIPGLRLIVIDVLARIRPSRQGNQSVYDGDYAVGAALKAVAADFPDLAILVVHHARKGEGDALESVSGSYGLSGGVDNVFTMMNGTGGMALHINGRDIENSSEIPLTKDEAGMWTLESRQAAREAQRSETRTAILNALKAGASTPRDIASETGIGANTVQQQLLRMQKAGDVAKTGWGKYDLANPDPTRLAAKNRTSSE